MAIFAVIYNEDVINIVMAESREIAEEVTGYTCIEDTDGSAQIEGWYRNNVFISRKPHASWVLDGNNKWQPPLEKPSDGSDYYWDEDLLNWVPFTLPE